MRRSRGLGDVYKRQGLAHFKSDTIQYWVAIEKNSKFGG
jgi:hypothetical protein